MKKINVLFDSQALTGQRWGGVSRYFYEVVVGLEKYNCNVDIPTLFSKNYYFESYFNAIENKIHKSLFFEKLLRKFIRDPQKKWTLARNRSKYDIIHPTYYDTYILGKFNGKLVTTIHDMNYELFPNYFHDTEEIVANKKAHIYQSDAIIAVSQCTKDRILDIYPDIDPDKITVIYHGNSLMPQENRESFFDKPYILHVGGRAGYKNFEAELRAVAKILKEKDMYLVCGGSGDFTPQEKKLIEELGVVEYCRQMNYSDEDLAVMYANAVCFIYPSLYEGFGIPILESWACKCPVVLANASCFPEVAENAAVYFDPTDLGDIERAIRTVVEDKALRENLINSGLERLKLFSWDRTVKETYNLYCALLNK